MTKKHDFMGNMVIEERLYPPSPCPHHHHYSHINVPHLSNQIGRCVNSAVAFYMNNKLDYNPPPPLYQLTCENKKLFKQIHCGGLKILK